MMTCSLTPTLSAQDSDLFNEGDQKWQASFAYGEAFEGEGESKEIVVAELDATMLHSQEGKGKNIAVRYGWD